MDTSSQLGDLLIAVNKEIKTKVERDLKRFDIGMGQLQILMAFYAQAGKAYSQNQLARLLNVDKGNISRSITKLLDKSYLEKDPDNSREYRLSEKGRQLKSEISACFARLNESMTAGLDKSDLRQMVLSLAHILKNIEAMA